MTRSNQKTRVQGICVADRNFPPDVYKPDRVIAYSGDLNRQILDLIRKNPTQYWKAFRHDEHRHLLEYVMGCTRHMPEGRFRLKFRLFWVLNEWQDFPKCTVCGMRLVLDDENAGFRLKLDPDGRLVYKWPRTCCPAHAMQDETTHCNYVSTCMRKYGCRNTFQVREFKDKATAKLQERYGEGVTSPAKSEEVLKKMQDTCLKKYGVENPYQAQQFKEKSRNTYFKRTGYEYPSQNPDVRRKSYERQVLERGFTHLQIKNKSVGYAKNILGSEYDEPLFSLEEFASTDSHVVPMKFRCRKCGMEFESVHMRTHARCPSCWPEDRVENGPLYLSKLNLRMFRVLDEMNVEYQKEFRIGTPDGKSHRRYDVKVDNVLVELNGDYWHARPGFMYNGMPITAETVIGYCFGRCRAREIWDYDAEKKTLAESNGYKFLILWEGDMNRMTDDELKCWIRENVMKSLEISANSV